MEKSLISDDVLEYICGGVESISESKNAGNQYIHWTSQLKSFFTWKNTLILASSIAGAVAVSCIIFMIIPRAKRLIFSQNTHVVTAKKFSEHVGDSLKEALCIIDSSKDINKLQLHVSEMIIEKCDEITCSVRNIQK